MFALFCAHVCQGDMVDRAALRCCLFQSSQCRCPCSRKRKRRKHRSRQGSGASVDSREACRVFNYWDSEEETEPESPCKPSSAASGQTLGRRANMGRTGDVEQGSN